MSWQHRDALGGPDLAPAAGETTTGKDQLVDGVTLDDRKLQVAVKGSGFNPLPCLVSLRRLMGTSCRHVQAALRVGSASSPVFRANRFSSMVLRLRAVSIA